MKRILGLDLGTNSIGWALTQQDFVKKEGKIDGIGSRIIPMSQDILGKFDSGISISQTAERTGYRSVRRLTQRHLLRRERLHRVLNILGYLPKHYANSIDFEKNYGQFKKNTEVKLNYFRNDKGNHEFIFKDTFNEMLEDFKKKGQDTKIPYDWTLYYLRKKALSEKISKEELSWIILNFNQKRGYYQLRGEETEDNTKKEEFYTLKVIDVKATEDKNIKGTWYNVILENTWIYRRQSKEPLNNWIGKYKEFIITTQIEKDGTLKLDKDGAVKRSFRAVDSEKDWIAIKKKTEQDINESKKTVGQYIYETLLENPKQKIRGKLIKTIERKFYKDEFRAIIKEQIKYHKELQDKKTYDICINELYPRNEAHQNNIKEKDFEYLFLDDIIFYQRPLKSKKSTISNCQYEYREYKIKGIKQPKQYLKTTSKSNPLFQEFRLWQFLKNLTIYQKEGVINEKTKIDIDVTSQLLQTEDDWVALFDFLNRRKEVEQKNLIQYFITKKVIPKKDKNNYRWNYVEDKKYPSNTTKSQILSRLKKVNSINVDTFLTPEIEYKLWHIIYSVKDKNEFEQALKTFAKKHSIDIDTFVESFKKHPPYKSDYAAYSEKAIKKLLPLMRRGKYWKKDAIPQDVKERVFSIMERVNGIKVSREHKDFNNEIIRLSDDDIPKQLLKSFINFKDKEPTQALNTYQACYAVYNRHSEVSDVLYWKHPQDITDYLDKFKQHSLRNPIVEQVVTETLRTVRDIWEYYARQSKIPFIEKINTKTGNIEKHYERLFDKIHVELGREMKNPANKRKAMTSRISENENTNHRIKELLKEFMSDAEVEGEIRPYSSSQQEILKIYEEGIYQSIEKVNDDIEKIRKNATPSKSEITKYKLWLEQGYISPYTGEIIPLSKLFTTDYQIEHVIPQSRYFDNSMSNKVICESAINPNPYKDNQTAYEFIKNMGGQIVSELSTKEKTVKLFNLEQYESHCNKYFKKNRSKLKKLLSEDIPEGFINRQLNDSRYISKLVKGLLSNLVREENEQEATSKHIVPVTGSITSKLKHDWGLNDKWNELIAPRFIRLNEITNSNDFGYWDKKINAFRTQVPDKISKGFSKKRIDHRHHALDALVIACCTKKHTNYLGALNSEKKNYGLRDSLLIKNKEGHYTKHFMAPWNGFTTDAKSILEKTIVSFKQNLRVINKTNNKTWQWVKKDGILKKELVKQTKGDNWAIRKPMHKETVSGKVVLRRQRKGTISFSKALENWQLLVDKGVKTKVKAAFSLFDRDLKQVKAHFKKNPIVIDGKEINRVTIYEKIEASATRIPLTNKFTRKQLESITDTGIQKILENHIKNHVDENGEEQFDLAFNSDGVEELNKNMVKLNNGKKHQPIYKVRIYEVGNKFNVGLKGNRKDKFVEAAKGTNLFFAIYWDDKKQSRVYETIPLNEVIEHQKWRATLPREEMVQTPLIPLKPEKGQFLFSLSPNDLVYMPTDEEIENSDFVGFKKLSKEQISRIYKSVSSTGNRFYGLPSNVSKSIKNKYEYTSLNKLEFDLFGNSLKSKCWKLEVDRLGNIISFINHLGKIVQVGEY